jgi:hypothetical protein
MRTLLSILLVTLIFASDAFGQSRSLVLTRRKTKAETEITEGKIITITDISGQRFKGHFKILNDSEIIIKSDTISVEQIVKLRIKLIDTVIPGLGMSAVGIMGSGLGIFLISLTSGEAVTLGLIAIDCGVAIFTAGFIGLASVGVTWVLIGKKYTSEKWEFRLVQ